MPRALPSLARLKMIHHRSASNQEGGNEKEKEYSFPLMTWPEIVGILKLIYLGQKLLTLFFFVKGSAKYSTEKKRVDIDGTIH